MFFVKFSMYSKGPIFGSHYLPVFIWSIRAPPSLVHDAFLSISLFVIFAVITQKFEIVERILYEDEISESKKINVWSFIQCKMKCQFEPSCRAVAINRLKDTSWDCFLMRTKRYSGIDTWRRKKAFEKPVKVFTKILR